MTASSPPHGRRLPWSSEEALRGLGLVVLLGALFFAASLLLERALGFSVWRRLSPAGRTIGLSLAEAILLLPVGLFALGRGARLPDLGLRPFAPGRAVARAFGALVLIALFNWLYAALLQQVGLQVQPEVLPFFGLGTQGLLLALVAAGLVAPVAEELFFRGFLYPGLIQRLGRTGASLASALAFALAHVLPTTILPLFVIGLLLNWLYDQTGSIWPGMGLHAVLNGLALLASFATLT